MVELIIAGCLQQRKGITGPGPLIAALLLPLFLSIPVLLRQYMEWTLRGVGRKFASKSLIFLLLWFPLIVYLLLPVLEDRPFSVPPDFTQSLKWVIVLSPLAILYSRSGVQVYEPYSLTNGGMMVALVLYVFIIAALVFLHHGALRRLKTQIQFHGGDQGEIETHFGTENRER